MIFGAESVSVWAMRPLTLEVGHDEEGEGREGGMEKQRQTKRLRDRESMLGVGVGVGELCERDPGCSVISELQDPWQLPLSS